MSHFRCDLIGFSRDLGLKRLLTFHFPPPMPRVRMNMLQLPMVTAIGEDDDADDAEGFPVDIDDGDDDDGDDDDGDDDGDDTGDVYDSQDSHDDSDDI